MALTDKQQREAQQELNQQIAALRQLAMHIGLIAPCTALAISRDEQLQRVSRYGVEPILYCVDILFDEGSSQQQKAACGVLLECFIPDWREILGPRAFGHILDRDDTLVRKWRSEVLSRDNHTCRHCGSNRDLHAHHIVRWADCPELRVELSNGLTLCKSCHEAEHAQTR